MEAVSRSQPADVFLSLSLNQGLLLEQGRLRSDYDKLKAEEQEKDAKLQRLM